MSNLLLCQCFLCPSLCPDGDDICRTSLRNLFMRASNLSSDMYNNSMEMFNEFDEQYAQGKPYRVNTTNNCHTYFLHIPEDKEHIQRMHNKGLIRWILMLLYSWNKPLYQLVTDLRSMKEVSHTILSSARENVKRVKELQALIERPFSQVSILRKIYNAGIYWYGGPLKSRDEDVRHSAFYNLFLCLQSDSRKIDTYTKLLACRQLYDNC
uniref:Uncharacterized protein n=1 Tax=Moschus moschiferus TaxID=68415 RepID=A0A8C6DRT7_MOSMO